MFYGDKVVGESAMKSYDNIGPIIEHIYTVSCNLLFCQFDINKTLIVFKISNLGPYTVNNFTMKFYWPFETNLTYGANHKHGKHLLYLIEKPIVSFFLFCFPRHRDSLLQVFELNFKKIPNDHPIELKCDLIAALVDPISIQQVNFIFQCLFNSNINFNNECLKI